MKASVGVLLFGSTLFIAFSFIQSSIGSEVELGESTNDNGGVGVQRPNERYQPHVGQSESHQTDAQNPYKEENEGNPPERIIEGGEMVMRNDKVENENQPEEEVPKKKPDKRPNIILIMTDDQDVELGSMEYMPETLKMFRENGVEFRHGYVTTPMCCPSRSSILTGVYVHNHNVYTNNDNCSSIAWREKYEKKTFGAYLWSSGYYTSYIGKYLNKYDGSHIPYGWDEWNGLLMNSKFYNYTVNRNGRKIRHGFDYQQDYYPDVIANETIDFLNRIGSQKSQEDEDGNKDKPFLLVISFPSPHGPEDSAPQYSHLFLNATSHHTPNYDHAPNLDKQWILRQTQKMTPILKDFTDLLMTKRLQTLQSVDTSVKDIYTVLEAKELLDNTYIFYTSDHGYHVGQFGLVKGKAMPYEFDIRVPYYLRGPHQKVGKGIKIMEPVLNIDLAATFLDLAGIPVPEDMDGRSILPLLQRYGPQGDQFADIPFIWKDVFLIESSGRRDAPHQGGSVAAGNRSSDRDSRKSVKRRSKKERLKLLLEENKDSIVSTADRLCLLHPYPCLPGQKRYCKKDRRSERLHMKKCQASDYVQDFFLTPEMNDPQYHMITGRNTSDPLQGQFHWNVRKCVCPGSGRRKRSLGEPEVPEDFDWSSERRTIDEEINSLKRKIEELRRKRKNMRKKWIHKQSDPSTSPKIDPVDFSSTERSRNEEDTDSVKEPAREFSNQDFDLESDSEDRPETEILTTTVGPQLPETTATTQKTRKRPSQYEEEEEDDEDDEDEEEEEDDTSEDEEDDEEDEDEEDEYEEELRRRATSTTTTTTTTSTTTTTTTTTPATTTTTKQYRNGHGHQKHRRVNGHSRNGSTGRKNKHQELGLDLDLELDSFVRHKGRGKGRQKNRQRPFTSRTSGIDEPDAPTPASSSSSNSDILGTHNENSAIEVPPVVEEECDCRNDPRWIKQLEREERKRKKILGKVRKQQKYKSRIEDPEVLKQAESCGTEEKMNCFWHDSDHWKTEPFWTKGSFCFCMNSNNNTYSCLRSVNATHNYLYCQFVTGFKMYFDLNKDPYQLKNAIATLPADQEDWMVVQLIHLKKCKGRTDCWTEVDENQQAIQSTIWEQIFGRWPKKRRRGHRKRNFHHKSSRLTVVD